MTVVNTTNTPKYICLYADLATLTGVPVGSRAWCYDVGQVWAFTPAGTWALYTTGEI